MKATRKRIVAIVGAACAFICIAAALAQQTDKPAPTKGKDVVNIDGDKWKWHGGDDKSAYTITGHVVVRHGDTTVTADKAEYDEKSKVVVVDTNVKIVDGENVITGDKATTFLNDRKNVIEGHVRLVGTPKKSSSAKDPATPSAKMREPTTITCDKLEYLYRKKIATVEGNLKITQKDRVLVGSRGVYDVNQELVTLTGGVKVTDEKGQTFSSPGDLRASLKEGSEWIESGSGSASLKVDLDEEKDKEPQKPADKAK